MAENSTTLKKRRFSLRMQKYKHNRAVKGMNQYDAAIAAGYKETYAKQACRIEKLVKVSLGTALERAGFTDKRVAQVVTDGAFEATKLFGLDNEEHPDWMARHKFLITGLELKGQAPNPKANNEGSEELHLRVLNIINTYNYNITVEDNEKPKTEENIIDVKIEPADIQVRDGVKIA